MPDPSLPDGTVWYRNEPLWQAIAEGRLNHGLRTFVLEVAQRSSLGVDRGLHGAVKSSGFTCGAWSEDARNVTWYIHGDFAPIAAITEKHEIGSSNDAVQPDPVDEGAQPVQADDDPDDRRWGHAEDRANFLELMDLVAEIVTRDGPIPVDDIAVEVARIYRQSISPAVRSAVVRALDATKHGSGLRYNKTSDVWEVDQQATAGVLG